MQWRTAPKHKILLSRGMPEAGENFWFTSLRLL